MANYRMATGRRNLKASDLDRRNADFIPPQGLVSGSVDFPETTGSSVESRIALAGCSRWTPNLLFVLSLYLICAMPAALFAQNPQPQIQPLVIPENAYFLGLQTTLASGLNGPNSVAVDKAGNVFIGDAGNNEVVEVPAGGGTPTTLSISLSETINGIAVDGDDNLYIAEGNGSSESVIKVSANGGPQTALGSGWELPEGIAVDGAGDVFVADYGTDKVVELPVGGGQVALNVTFTTFPSVSGVAVDRAGDVFAYNPAGQVVELPAGGGAQISMSFDGGQAIAVDAAGDLFVSIAQAGQPGSVIEAPAGGGSQITLQTTGLNVPTGLAVDSSGNVFITDPDNERVVEFKTRALNFVSANVCPAGQLTPTPCSQTLTLNVDLVTGTGGQPALTPAIVTQGAANQEFFLSGTTCGTYSALDYDCAYTVTFAPMYSGMRSGAFKITAGAGGPALLTVPLYGIGIAPQLVFDSTVQTTIPTTGLVNPVAVAVDGAGDVFIVDPSVGSLVEMPAGGGAQITVDTELSDPLGVAVDGAGDLFIADHGNQRVVEIPTGSGAAWKTVGRGLGGPAGVAVDAIGDVFISDYTNDQVVEVPAGGGPQITVASAADGLKGPRGIAVDQAGDLFIASSLNSLVLEIPFQGSPTAVGTGWNAPYGVTVDAAGDVYVADYGQTSIVAQVSGGESNLLMGSGLRNPTGVAMDGAGNLFIADYDNGRVLRLPRSTPPSLSFDATVVGSISNDSPQTVTLQNIGSSFEFVDLSNISTAVDFPITAPNGSSFCLEKSILLRSGQSCGLFIEFAPESVGKLNDNLTFTDHSLNANSATHSIALSGTGIAPSTPSTLTSPASGSKLTGPSATFVWTPVSGATAYILWLGTTGVGSNNLWSSGATTATSVTYGALPTNGATIYARLWTTFGSVTLHTDYAYTAESQAAMTSPASGSTFAGPSVTFKWSTAAGATSYILWMGTSGVGSNNLWSSGATTATSVTFGAMPTNGEKIYVRLWTTLSGATLHADYAYTTATQAVMTSPTSSSTFTGSSVTFKWTAGTGATAYAVWVGSTGVGSNNLGSSGGTTATSFIKGGLPTNGEKIYVRLWTTLGGISVPADYTYTAVSQSVLTSPTPESTFTSSSETFTWSAVSGATEYDVWLGSTGAGSNNLGGSGGTTALSYTKNGLPTNGEKIYVRLFTLFNGGSVYTDYTYTAF